MALSLYSLYLTPKIANYPIHISAKGGFFSKSAMCFSHCQNKYSKSVSWAWNLNKLFSVMGGKFKFQVQESDLEYLFWQCEKLIALSEKRPLYVYWPQITHFYHLALKIHKNWDHSGRRNSLIHTSYLPLLPSTSSTI